MPLLYTFCFIACPSGTYKPEGSPGGISTCILCPDESHTSPPGSTSMEDCICKEGYRPRGKSCEGKLFLKETVQLKINIMSNASYLNLSTWNVICISMESIKMHFPSYQKCIWQTTVTPNSNTWFMWWSHKCPLASEYLAQGCTSHHLQDDFLKCVLYCQFTSPLSLANAHSFWCPWLYIVQKERTKIIVGSFLFICCTIFKAPSGAFQELQDFRHTLSMPFEMQKDMNEIEVTWHAQSMDIDCKIVQRIFFSIFVFYNQFRNNMKDNKVTVFKLSEYLKGDI